MALLILLRSALLLGAILYVIQIWRSFFFQIRNVRQGAFAITWCRLGHCLQGTYYSLRGLIDIGGVLHHLLATCARWVSLLRLVLINSITLVRLLYAGLLSICSLASASRSSSISRPTFFTILDHSNLPCLRIVYRLWYLFLVLRFICLNISVTLRNAVESIIISWPFCGLHFHILH